MTHDELVKRASRWLLNTKYCSVVATELVAGGNEIPDAIGWHGSCCIVVEAKVSVEDFKADQHKSFRRYPENGLGGMRYYIIPEELADKIFPLLPEKWGLLVCRRRGLVIVKPAEYFYEHDKAAEIIFLTSVIRRIAGRPEPLRGVNVRCYTYQVETEPKAELFIVPENQVYTQTYGDYVCITPSEGLCVKCGLTLKDHPHTGCERFTVQVL